MKKVSSSFNWKQEEVMLTSAPAEVRILPKQVINTLLTQINGDSIMNGHKKDTLVVLTASTPEGKSRLTPGELYRSADRVIGIEKAKPEDFPEEITLHNSLTGKSRTMRLKGRPELQNVPMETTMRQVEVFHVQDFAELEKRASLFMDKPEVQEALKLPKNHPARFATLYGGFV